MGVGMLNAWIVVKPWSDILHIFLITEAVHQISGLKTNISQPVDQEGFASSYGKD